MDTLVRRARWKRHDGKLNLSVEVEEQKSECPVGCAYFNVLDVD